MLREILGGVAKAAKWIGMEVIVSAAERAIPQGSNELASAMFTGQAYSPLVGQEAPEPDPIIVVLDRAVERGR